MAPRLDYLRFSFVPASTFRTQGQHAHFDHRSRERGHDGGGGPAQIADGLSAANVLTYPSTSQVSLVWGAYFDQELIGGLSALCLGLAGGRQVVDDLRSSTPTHGHQATSHGGELCRRHPVRRPIRSLFNVRISTCEADPRHSARLRTLRGVIATSSWSSASVRRGASPRWAPAPIERRPG